MRYIYNTVFYLILPFLLLRLRWKSRLHNWQERFGYLTFPILSKSIWIHAVSLGEAVAAIPLIKRLQQLNVVVTTTTLTGSEKIKKTFADSIYHVYAPFDYSGAVNRFLNHINPQLIIIMETELWPNILHFAHKRNIPILLANARLSEKSMRGYQYISTFTKEMLANITMIAAQSQADADRFNKLGAKKIEVMGNIKFDISIPESLPDFRKKWGWGRPIWLAASTHEGEEKQILAALNLIKKTLPTLLLVIVPRHPERFAHVTELCRKQGFKVIRHSKSKNFSEADIIIGDTIGELLAFYAASDVAFVGGSLITTVGGHNLLEPAALGIPIITGPNLFNFQTISRLLKQTIIIVNDPQQLAQNVIKLIQNKNIRQTKIQEGLNIIAHNKGALDKIIGWIKKNINVG